MKTSLSYQRRGFILLLLFIAFLAGCKKEKMEEKEPFHMEIHEYTDENIVSFAISEAEEVYISGIDNDNYYLHRYDIKGNLADTFKINAVHMNGLAVSGNIVYIASNTANEDGMCVALYSFNTETKELIRLWDFNYFQVVKQLIFYDGMLYLLGSNSGYKESTLEQFNRPYEDHGERLVCYSIEENLTYELGIQIPISMSLTEKGTLMVYSYLENEGYCMVEYNPDKDTATMNAKFEQNRFHQFASAHEGKSIIFTTMVNSRGLVITDLSRGEQEAELYENVFPFGADIYYLNNYVYFMNRERRLLKLSLSSVNKSNQVIRYISPEYHQDISPYGCGYMMEKKELDYDKFTLKILAQNPDYDLALINSSYHGSDNLRKNGSFYPLNDVEGIWEYLDSSFPYVKEAAMNENGDIWMLPISINIPGLIVNKEKIKEDKISMKNNISYEEFLHVLNAITEENFDKLDLNMYSLKKAFWNQYFYQFKYLDNELFRNKVNLLREYYYKIPTKNQNIDYRFTENFYMVRVQQEHQYKQASEFIEESKRIKAYGMPKFTENSRNIGTVVFLTVNPNSDRLKDTLYFLSDWISYTMNVDETPLYFRKPIPEEGTFKHSVYELYHNSDIAFSLDQDLIIGFDEVIEQDIDLEEYIRKTDKRLDIYFNE